MQLDRATDNLIKNIGSRDTLLHWRDTVTMCEFECTQYDVLEAEMEVNRTLAYAGLATMNDFFDFIPNFDRRVVERISGTPDVFSQGWCDMCFEFYDGTMWIETMITHTEENGQIIFEIHFDLMPCYKAGSCDDCDMDPIRLRGDIRQWV